MIPTPHIEVKEQGVIASTVLMPGDPLRAKFIAENYLEDAVQFNQVRGMYGYTGTWKGKRVSVMGSGMGMPSIGIYSYELFAFYQVENIIRVGSCGAYAPELKLYDVLLATEAWSESTYAKVQGGVEGQVLPASEALNKKLVQAAEGLGIPLRTGRIHSSDVFYRQDHEAFKDIRDKEGCIAVEMESFALFANARILGKKASCILTVSDSLATREATTSGERQRSFTKMMDVALQGAVL
ncbi:purine-nucleoside phosphorylase [Anaerotalea alkaliphila]|uniref:Uridine phosphorylase n=1 Tax=Anaerotalea alkaliphila TaxID=2662126 RepID=A0A7X5KPA1_9FIRM|nr:purine-nucleoside phosphorylase [Anaerotalea alkaliphila]NDL67772.1 purine-nucleoside phosphorylase [Anaerotalea alkaliphila]